MVCEAICKIEGFTYEPSGEFQGHSSENRFIHITEEFVSDDERRLSVVLEEDSEVIRFIKPPLNQLGLFYKAAKQYNPDFLVETADKKYMIEVKAVNQTDNEDVQEKAKAAIKWCECASQVDADGKTWEYRLVPGDKIIVGNTFKYVIGMANPVVVDGE